MVPDVPPPMKSIPEKLDMAEPEGLYIVDPADNPKYAGAALLKPDVDGVEDRLNIPLPPATVITGVPVMDGLYIVEEISMGP